MNENNTLFAKNRSGFRRSIGTLGAMLFGIHCISLSSSGYIPFSWVASSWPGASIIAVLILSALLAIVHGYCFAAVGAAIPRAGADYVLASRFVNPAAAFVSSWTFVIFSSLVAGGLIAWIPKTAIPALFQPMAIIFNKPAFTDFASWASSSSGIMIIGFGCICLTGALMFLPNRITLRILGAGLILGLSAWLIIYYVLGSAAGPDEFKTAWDRFVGSTSNFGGFDQRIDLAKQIGMKLDSSAVTMTLAGLTMGFWIYYGYAIPTFFSSEIRESKGWNPLLVASMSSVIVACVIFVGGAILLQRLVPLDWIAAEGFLNNNAAAASKFAGQEVPSFPWITFYAAILRPNPFLIGIVAVAWIYTLINLAQTYFFYVSRIVFAWALDRRIPAVFVRQTSTGCPPACILAIAILAAVGVWDASDNGPIGPQLTFIFFAALTQLVTVMALWRFPKKAAAQFRLLPRFVTKVVLGQPIIRWVALITFVYLIWILSASFLFPAVGVAAPTKTVMLLAIIAGAGAVLFYGMRRYRLAKTGSLDDVIFSTMPPE